VSEKIKDGIVKKFDDDGKLSGEYSYKDGYKHGPFKTYDTRNGKLHCEGSYFNYHNESLLDGTYRIYYDNGQIMEEIHYRVGKIDGDVKYYHYDGMTNVKRQNGVFKEYHYNGGKTFIETTFKDGKKNGPEKWYYEDGKLQSKYIYENDKPVDGTFKSYDENGKVDFQQDFRDGKENGESIRFKNGKIVSKSIYQDGKPIRLKDYNIHGEVISDGYYDEYGVFCWNWRSENWLDEVGWEVDQD
jgi:antitoxin component YwqK of YwqJK toxin-antitoxin module